MIASGKATRQKRKDNLPSNEELERMHRDFVNLIEQLKLKNESESTCDM